MYSARFEIPKSEFTTFVNANSHLFDRCEFFSMNYSDYISVNFSSNDEFRVTTLEEIYHYVSDDNRKKEMQAKEPALPF